MSKKAFDKIAAGLNDALAVARGRREMEDEETIIEKFDADLTEFWPGVEAHVAGLLFPQAAAIVKSYGGPLMPWLNERMSCSDMIGGCPEYVIVCDRRNNPPTAIAENKMIVTLHFKLFGKVWTRDLRL